MPVMKCSNGKYKIGQHGKCEYDHENAEKAYKGYLGSKFGKYYEDFLNDVEGEASDQMDSDDADSESDDSEGLDMDENENPTDVVHMDIPLFLRLLEFAREDANNDLDLHWLTQKATSVCADGTVLSMENYDDLIDCIPATDDEEEEGNTHDDTDHSENDEHYDDSTDALKKDAYESVDDAIAMSYVKKYANITEQKTILESKKDNDGLEDIRKLAGISKHKPNDVTVTTNSELSDIQKLAGIVEHNKVTLTKKDDGLDAIRKLSGII